MINGSFELLGGLLYWLNVRRLLRDKRVSGVSWGVQVFFTSWSLWNLYYYPSLGQWASFIGGVLLCIANIIWVVLALKFILMKEETNEQ